MIQVFSGGCELCKDMGEIVEVGKCKDCKLEVLRVESKESSELVKKYDVTAVPFIVVDGKKVVGKPTFPWFCGDEFYKMLERKYPLTRSTDGERERARGKRELAVITSCGGALGAAFCTVAMLLPVIIRTAGAGASVACSMPGMCGVQLGGGWRYSLMPLR